MRNQESWEPYREQHGTSELWGVRTATAARPIIRATTALDGEDASLIARTHNARLSRPDQIMVTSIVSHRTLQPVYQFAFGEVTWELGLRELRTYIEDIYQALEAGVTDAFITHFVRQKMMPSAPRDEQDATLGALLTEFRMFRDVLNNPPPVEGGETVS